MKKLVLLLLILLIAATGLTALACDSCTDVSDDGGRIAVGESSVVDMTDRTAIMVMSGGTSNEPGFFDVMIDNFLALWWIYLIIALVIAGVTVAIMYSMSKSMSKQKCLAMDYAESGSFKLSRQENRYRGTTITRVPLQTNTRVRR